MQGIGRGSAVPTIEQDQENSTHINFNASDPVPVQISMGVVIQHHDLRTSHGEADIITAQQTVSASEMYRSIKVISDDTDVIALLLH